MKGQALRASLAAIAITLSGLVGLAFALMGPDVYEELLRRSGTDRVELFAEGGVLRAFDLAEVRPVHEATVAYVSGGSNRLPSFPESGEAVFDDAERSHLTDVRGIVLGARALAFAGIALFALMLTRESARGHLAVLRLVRNSALLSAAAVIGVAILASLAFAPLFLVFHLVLFPQGNFLFDPASNLIRVYPEAYWYGMTIAIGLAHVVVTATVALGSTILLRRESSRVHE